MLPITFSNPFDASGATWNAAAGTMAILTPESAKPGDLLVMAIGLRIASASVFTIDGDAAFAGWTLVQTIATANNKLYLFTRRMTDDDIGTHTATFTPTRNGQAGMLALRGVDSIPASGAGVDVVAGTNWPCPAQTIARLPDAYLGIIVSDVVAATLGSSYELHYTDGVVGIEMGMLYPSATGPMSNAGTTGTNRSGIAASFMLVGDALPDAARDRLTISMQPSGTIGLPVEGI